MTWGTHCHQCGREDCGWSCGDACQRKWEGLKTENVRLRGALEALREPIHGTHGFQYRDVTTCQKSYCAMIRAALGDGGRDD